METTIVYWAYIGIMEKNMETTILYRGTTGKMDKNMDTTIEGSGFTVMEFRASGLGFHSRPSNLEVLKGRTITQKNTDKTTYTLYSMQPVVW